MKFLYIFLIIFLLNNIILCDHYDPENGRSWSEYVTMRDGTKLHTRTVLPPRRMGNDEQYITILDRSPYGYSDLEWISDIMSHFGNFVMVGQDMRGTETSEGVFTLWHADDKDAYDTMQWIEEQSWSNGIVYTFGASADGVASFVDVYSMPPQLQKQYIVWSSPEFYKTIYPNGAYRQSLSDVWIRGTVDNATDAEKCIEEVQLNEPDTDFWSFDEYHKGDMYQYVDWQVYFWAGWYDIFTDVNLIAFDGFRWRSPEKYQDTSKILVDPLGHCQAGADYFPEHLVEGRTLLGIFQMYELYGIRNVIREIQEVTFYVMGAFEEGSPGNYWTTMYDWPEYVSHKLYFQSNGYLDWVIPDESESIKSSSYVYDPNDPTPSIGGNNLNIPCGPLDQKPNEERSDVLIFETDPLEDDVALTGPMFAKIYVSSDAIDTDFMVKLIDQYPTGEARLIMDNAVRMRWRDQATSPIFMEEGEVYEVEFSLWNTSYIFPKDHQIKVHITSANYPRFSANPNNGKALNTSDFTGPNITATNQFYHSSEYPSYIDLPIIGKDDIPEFDLVQLREKYSELIKEIIPEGETLKSFGLDPRTPWNRGMLPIEKRNQYQFPDGKN